MDFYQESWFNCKMLGSLGWFYRFPRPNGDHLGFSDFYGSDFFWSFTISSRIENVEKPFVLFLGGSSGYFHISIRVFTNIQIDSIDRIQRNFTRYALHYPTINYKEHCEYSNILSLPFRREVIDIKLFFKSSAVSDSSDIVASLLSDYKPDSRPRSSQNGTLFYLSELRRLTVFIYIHLESITNGSAAGTSIGRLCT